VYDNAEDWDTIKNYWPRSEQGSIIITSQRLDLAQVSAHSAIALQPLAPADGGLLLLKHLRRTESPISMEDQIESLKISETLGGLPVAIAHMAGYIDKSNSTLQEFSAMYKRRDQTHRIWSQNCRAWTYQYDRTLDTVWDIALAELNESARAMINLLAMLDPDRIPEKILFSDPLGEEMKSEYAHNSHCSSIYDIADQVRRSQQILISLRDRQLVHRDIVSDGPSWSIHRALQLNILHRLDQELTERQFTFDKAVTLVRQVYPRQSEMQAPSNENWRENAKWLPHAMQLQIVFECSNPPMKADSRFAELLSDAGNYMWERALYEQGVKTLELAERIYDTDIQDAVIEHSKVLTILGIVNQEIGVSGRERGLHWNKKCLGLRCQYEADPNIMMSRTEIVLLANAWNDLACSMLECYSYDQAERYLETSIRIKHERGIFENSEAFFNFAENYKNLAIAKIGQGQYDDALELSSRAVTLYDQHSAGLGASDQAFRFHHAYALFYKGYVDAALQVHEEVREARDRIIGHEEHHTPNSYYACAFILESVGRLTESEYDVPLLQLCSPCC
jgi:tetratricopeptide (TPR) repeat protein